MFIRGIKDTAQAAAGLWNYFIWPVGLQEGLGIQGCGAGAGPTPEFPGTEHAEPHWGNGSGGVGVSDSCINPQTTTATSPAAAIGAS